MRLQNQQSEVSVFSRGFAAGSRCPYCRDRLVAPESSELVDGRDIRHQWVCDACGRRSEIKVALYSRARKSGH